MGIDANHEILHDPLVKQLLAEDCHGVFPEKSRCFLSPPCLGFLFLFILILGLDLIVVEIKLQWDVFILDESLLGQRSYLLHLIHELLHLFLGVFNLVKAYLCWSILQSRCQSIVNLCIVLSWQIVL